MNEPSLTKEQLAELKRRVTDFLAFKERQSDLLLLDVQVVAQLVALAERLRQIEGCPAAEFLDAIFGKNVGTLGEGISAIASLKAQAKHFRAENERLRKDYNELLYAVERKFPDETRQQTALRYIQEAERLELETAAADSANTAALRPDTQTAAPHCQPHSAAFKPAH